MIKYLAISLNILLILKKSEKDQNSYLTATTVEQVQEIIKLIDCKRSYRGP